MKPLRRLIWIAALAGWWAAAGGPVRAHTPAETYLTLRVTATNLAGHWDVAQQDLQVTAGQAHPQWPRLPASEQGLWIEGLLMDVIAGLEIDADGRRLPLRITDLETVQLGAGDYQRVQFTAPAAGDSLAVLAVNARALFKVDTNAHGLVRIEHLGRTETLAFSAARPGFTFSLREPAGRPARVGTFVREGVGHIWQGPDHVLFLVALLLPAVLRQRDGRWQEPDSLKSASLRIVKIVTAFTLAHSITLSLAALELVRLSPRVVEPLIACSIIAAAANNLRPCFSGKEWLVALGFGLVHGFGLAGGLIEFGLSGSALALGLLGFNLGVEVGQLGIVAVFLPVAFLFCRSRYYRVGVLKFGSLAVAGIAAVWMAERLFACKILPF